MALCEDAGAPVAVFLCGWHHAARKRRVLQGKRTKPASRLKNDSECYRSVCRATRVIPDLLSILDLEGASVSLDAAGTHKEVAQQITDQGGDYVLALKANQGLLFAEAQWLFDYNQQEAISMRHTETFEVGHGREEQRRCWLLEDLRYLEQADCGLADWTHLSAIIVIESHTLRQGKTQTNRRLFLTSHHYTPKQALDRVRKHWSIENQQHYPLDVLFHEDVACTRRGFAAQNLAALRRLALNLLNLDTNTPLSKRRKRLKALHDDAYLLNLLGLEKRS